MLGVCIKSGQVGICFCDPGGKGVRESVLACQLVVEVDYQRVVPPVKGGEKVKETKQAHLRRTDEDRNDI